LTFALSGTTARASMINPSETAITPPGSIEWQPWSGAPAHSGEMARLYGDLDKPGPYLVLMKWYPGYMSAPHSYATDRLSLVLSGTWWVNSGADFDPDNTVPVPPGGFVRRAARHAALRWRQGGREGAGRHCPFRNCTRPAGTDGPEQARLASSLMRVSH
jgi:hypothetical protein